MASRQEPRLAAAARNGGEASKARFAVSKQASVKLARCASPCVASAVMKPATLVRGRMKDGADGEAFGEANAALSDAKASLLIQRFHGLSAR